MTNSIRPDRVRCDDVLAALCARGFTCEVVGEHAVATRDATRVVVPAAGRTVPDVFMRRLEHALRPILGPGWLRSETESLSRTSHRTGVVEIRVFDALVDQCPTEGDWCAFLSDQVSVMGTGTTRDGALRDLKAAAALWSELPVEHVLLVTPDLF